MDSDHDGLSDENEALFGTDPHNADSDNDGFLDGAEVQSGYNPTGEGKLADSAFLQGKSPDADFSELQVPNSSVEEDAGGVFETRKLLESEKDSEWFQDNELLDDQHLQKVQQKEEEYKKNVV